MASINKLTYVYEHNGRTIEVTRRHIGTAYASNGNVSNPTEYFVWDTTVDGKPVMAASRSRADAYEYGRARIEGVRYQPCNERGLGGVNVRHFMRVREEMQANYQRRVTQ